MRPRLLGGSVLLLGALAACAERRAPQGPATLVVAPPPAPEIASVPEESLAVRVWRAGREIPPGLPAARETELEEERARAAAELAAGLTAEEGERLAQWLADEGTPEELWCAAARVVGALERYELAPRLGRALEPAASASRAATARVVLHELYGRWFLHSAELAPYLDAVSGGTGTRLLLEGLRAEEARSRERLLAELAHRPASAATWLADVDPEVRSGAARVLARVFTREGEDQAGALATLIAHLEGEQDPRPFHEALLASCLPIERGEVDLPAALRLRTLLLDLARHEGDARAVSVAQALARIPWRRNGARDLGHVLTGIEALAAMLRSLAAADQRRGVNDPDPLVAVLSSLRQLCAQASAGGLSAELRGGAARASLLTLLGDAGQADAVRAAAAAALGSQALPEDGPRLAALLAGPAVGTQVKHALLGTLGALLPELEPGARGARELMLAVAEQSGAGDADLRRRALALLADPRLEALVRALDPAFLATRLERETGREATLEILGLIQRFGRADMLPALLALGRFDALCAESSTLEAFVQGLLRLARGSQRSALVVAQRLAAVPSEATQLSRLRHALGLVSELDEAAAFALTPPEHHAINTWSWQALRAGVAARELADGPAFEQRLLEVHVPRGAELRSAPGAGFGPFEAAHLCAILRADLFTGEPPGARVSKPEVEAAFEDAHRLAATPEARLLVLRDRARFRTSANEGVKALGDYRRLIEAGEQAEALLRIPDLRAAVGLLDRLDLTGGERRTATAGEACALLTRIVLRPAWQSEPASVRMQDLRDWVRTALDARELAALRRVEEALADLPLTQTETHVEREPAPIWSGLTREPSWFQELLDLRARARQMLLELDGQG